MVAICWETHVGHFWLMGFLLSDLIVSVVSGTVCQDPKCPFVSRSVSKGESVSIPLNSSETTLDLCKQNASTLEWDHVCSFVKGKPTLLSSSFKENVSLSGGNLEMTNVSAGAGGNYTLQNTDQKCLACIQLTVMGAGTMVASIWYLLPLLSLLQWL